MTPEQAELLGMHAGDGTLYRTNTRIVWELRGGLDEKEFYDNYVKNLVYKATGVKVKPKFRSGGKNGCYGIQSCSRKISSFLVSAGFPVGKKSLTVRIPAEITFKTDEIQVAFLRGLFATDGSIFLSKSNYSKVQNYLRIEVCSASYGLIQDVRNILSHLGIDSTTWSWKPKNGNICTTLGICGKKNKLCFLRIVGVSNPKHHARIPLKYTKETTVLKKKY